MKQLVLSFIEDWNALSGEGKSIIGRAMKQLVLSFIEDWNWLIGFYPIHRGLKKQLVLSFIEDWNTIIPDILIDDITRNN